MSIAFRSLFQGGQSLRIGFVDREIAFLRTLSRQATRVLAGHHAQGPSIFKMWPPQAVTIESNLSVRLGK